MAPTSFNAKYFYRNVDKMEIIRCKLKNLAKTPTDIETHLARYLLKAIGYPHPSHAQLASIKTTFSNGGGFLVTNDMSLITKMPLELQNPLDLFYIYLKHVQEDIQNPLTCNRSVAFARAVVYAITGMRPRIKQTRVVRSVMQTSRMQRLCITEKRFAHFFVGSRAQSVKDGLVAVLQFFLFYYIYQDEPENSWRDDAVDSTESVIPSARYEDAMSGMNNVTYEVPDRHTLRQQIKTFCSLYRRRSHQY